ncbi:MAG: amino acid permease [Acidobacteria bacterium]|nr:amino acid permease [Acidobacteriota bacterium]
MESGSKNGITLVRGLGLVAAVSIIIGNVIGTGVFLKARAMTCNVGTPGWVLTAWIAAGLLSLAGALTYAELTAMKPAAGGEYVFLRDAYGRLSSFLFGWMQMFVAKPGSQAAAAVAFAIGLNDFLGGQLAPQAQPNLFVLDLFGYSLGVTLLQVVALMAILIFTTLNCATVVLSGRIATVLTGVKIALILFVAGGAFLWATGDLSHFSMTNAGGLCQEVEDAVKYGSPSYSFIGGFAAAMIGALWGYDGWNNLTFVAGEVENPNRNIPLAIIGSTVLIILLYTITNFAYFYVLDPTSIASISKDSSVGKVVVSMFFGGNVAQFATGVAVALFATGLMLSSLGTLHTSILSGSRVPYAMAQDGLMFKPLGRLSITGVPIRALLIQMLLGMALVLTGSFDTLTDYVIFASWIFYAAVTSSIFVYRRKFPDLPRPYKAWGYPVVPVVFLLVAGWLLVNTMWNSPTRSFVGIGLILLGLPVYYYLTRLRSAPQEPEEQE